MHSGRRPQALAAIRDEIAARGITLAEAQSDLLEVPELRGLAAGIRSVLFGGPGVAIVRDWPVDNGDGEQASLLYWGSDRWSATLARRTLS